MGEPGATRRVIPREHECADLLATCLALGVCTSGHYVRTAESPAFKALHDADVIIHLIDGLEGQVETLAKAAVRLVETVDAIGRGEFPPTPDDVWRCETCSFASVCRKDYVGDV